MEDEKKEPKTVRCSHDAFEAIVALALAEGVKRGRPIKYQEIVDEAIYHYRAYLAGD